MRLAIHDTGPILIETLVWAMLTAVARHFNRGILCWWGRSNHGIRNFTFLLAATVLVTPGPIIGLGIKAMINQLMELESHLGMSVCQSWLYDGPSYLPIAWAWTIRCFPLAIAVLWPLCRIGPMISWM